MKSSKQKQSEIEELVSAYIIGELSKSALISSLGGFYSDDLTVFIASVAERGKEDTEIG